MHTYTEYVRLRSAELQTVGLREDHSPNVLLLLRPGRRNGPDPEGGVGVSVGWLPPALAWDEVMPAATEQKQADTIRRSQ